MRYLGFDCNKKLAKCQSQFSNTFTSLRLTAREFHGLKQTNALKRI